MRLGLRAGALRPLALGLLVTMTLAAAATLAAEHYGGPVMIYALLLGMAFHFVQNDHQVAAGVAVTSRSVLRAGIALLGARISADQVMGLGWEPMLLVTAATIVIMVSGPSVARALGLRRELGLLSGAAVAICGVSAVLAVASILPRRPETERDTLTVCVLVTAVSSFAMVTYPLAVTALGLNVREGGLLLGAAIHDVAQVAGAGYSLSTQHGDTAVLVKLMRVALLAPMIVVLAQAVARSSTQDRRQRLSGLFGLPWFLVAFLVLLGLQSAFDVPRFAVDIASAGSKWCLVAAVAGLGIRTRLGDLLLAGWRPVALMAALTIGLFSLVLALLAVLDPF